MGASKLFIIILSSLAYQALRVVQNADTSN